MLAISGGAPYAYITGLALPEQVQAVAVVSGAPPIAELSDSCRVVADASVDAAAARAEASADARPLSSRPAVCLPADVVPDATIAPLILQKMDADALRDQRAFAACFESSREAWRASVDGVMADAEIYAQPWGFASKMCACRCVSGMERSDRTFSFQLAEALARRMPKAELHIVEGAGHYSLPIRHIEQFLRDLIAV